MYVCVCNGMTERQVREAIGSGTRSVAAVYRARGCMPQCGRCVPEIRAMLQAETVSTPSAAG